MARHVRRLLLHRIGRTIVSAAAVTVVAFAAAERTIWDGIYSNAQAQRGKETYETFCASCHMDDLSGGGRFDCVEAPALKGEEFMEPRELGRSSDAILSRDSSQLIAYASVR
jgi:cytochrome c5